MKPNPVLTPVLAAHDQIKLQAEQWMVRMRYPKGSVLNVTMRVGGQVRQSSNTSKMIFPVDQCIEVLSLAMTLLPGDIIATGTPDGVGAATGNFLKGLGTGHVSLEPGFLMALKLAPETRVVLVRTGLDKAEWVAPVERDIERLIRDNPSQFVRVASFPIPLKEAEAIIYRRAKA